MRFTSATAKKRDKIMLNLMICRAPGQSDRFNLTLRLQSAAFVSSQTPLSFRSADTTFIRGASLGGAEKTTTVPTVGLKFQGQSTNSSVGSAKLGKEVSVLSAWSRSLAINKKKRIPFVRTALRRWALIDPFHNRCITWNVSDVNCLWWDMILINLLICLCTVSYWVFCDIGNSLISLRVERR